MSLVTEHQFAYMQAIALIAIGAFFGANARYVIGVYSPTLVGTFLANIAGCLLLGFLTYEAMYAEIDHRTHLLVGTGFTSSFTTYSTFALETAQAVPLVGLLNVTASYVVGFSAVYVGRFLACSVRGD